MKIITLITLTFLTLAACGESTDETTLSEVSSKVSESAKSEIETESESSKETMESDDDIDKSIVNELLDDYLSMNQSWALGELDTDGNPVENGEVYPQFLWSLLIEDVTMEDNFFKVNVNGDFVQASEDEKTAAAESVSGMIDGAVWESPYGDKLGSTKGYDIEFHNGKNPIGASKPFNKKVFEWY